MQNKTIKRFSGRVTRGSGDGTKIGFPTANILPNIDISGLKFGVYACDIYIEKKPYKGVAHYGPRAVFGETKPQFEVHILDFDKDIYGELVKIFLGKYIRETMNFDNLNGMIEQIHQDIKYARNMK
ncbi:MAG TPA: riboflavin kinase [Candidatus Dojkabacteria bacterium]|nr:riboflavin kinase [Candidatus Dojkabacteria bacterium]HRO65061.1 riboflavin kinase [Candidatus Dojkabacteria bacterium]HRP36692.1 riboflavin kinase [Candidatus Dojkabacteria bacterium]HRP51191.1 riboflavin kinase [Candidatus Dojkabacteria bacterium]